MTIKDGIFVLSGQVGECGLQYCRDTINHPIPVNKGRRGLLRP